MKNLFLFAFLLLGISQLAFSQDLIIKKSGEEIKARVKEITPTEVRYKRFDYLDGPDFVLSPADLFMIKFENGIKQVFSEAKPAQAIPVNPQPHMPVTVAPPQPAEPLAPAAQQLEGPRIGATLIGPGELADRLENDYSAGPLVTQFGWQFENRLFTTGSGTSGLIEWVPLIGGLEQGLFLPSLSALVGLRSVEGMEIGFGPNVSLAGAGLVVAAGITLQTDYVNVPLNFAVVPSRNGTRFSLLTGFNLRKR